mgnify:CR=1 FL=1
MFLSTDLDKILIIRYVYKKYLSFLPLFVKCCSEIMFFVIRRRKTLNFFCRCDKINRLKYGFFGNTVFGD